MKPVHLGDVDRGFSAGVNAAELCSLDPLTQGHVALFQIMNDVLHILHRSSDLNNARDNQDVTGTKEFEKDGQFSSSATARAAFLLGADNGASESAQGSRGYA